LVAPWGAVATACTCNQRPGLGRQVRAVGTAVYIRVPALKRTRHNNPAIFAVLHLVWRDDGGGGGQVRPAERDYNLFSGAKHGGPPPSAAVGTAYPTGSPPQSNSPGRPRGSPRGR
jgi:hypothetical protein